MGLHCLRPELLKVLSFRLLSCFKLTVCQHLIIYQFAVNMQYFKKDMKKILFQVQEFQIAQEATSPDSQLALSKFNLWGQVGNCISNTAYHRIYIRKSHFMAPPGLIWIQSVWHSDGIPERFFRKSWFWNKSASWPILRGQRVDTTSSILSSKNQSK